MGTSLTVLRTENTDLIRGILSDPQLADEISENGVIPESMAIDTEKNCFCVVSGDTGPIGLYIFHPLNSTTVEIHANILPEFRKKFADESLIATLRWLDENMPEQYSKLVAMIPEMYQNVLHFALKHGFVEEGKLTKAYRKNGTLHDLHILAMFRDQV